MSTPTRYLPSQSFATPPSMLKSALVSPERPDSYRFSAEQSHPPWADDDVVAPPEWGGGDDDDEDAEGELDILGDFEVSPGLKLPARTEEESDTAGSARDAQKGGGESLPGGQGGRFSEEQLQEVEKHARVFRDTIAGLARSWRCHVSTLYRVANITGTLTKHRKSNPWNSFQHQRKVQNLNPSGLGAKFYLGHAAHHLTLLLYRKRWCDCEPILQASL
jgi:hypothetical protein